MSANKFATDRNQRVLLDLVSAPGNDVCADCRTRAPRWASHSLGIFLCVNCASIHRKMGTHISKVKSLTLDSWTKEQVEVMKQMGNIKSNAHFNPNEARHPPPTNMVDSERDSELEKFIRRKYEFKSFLDKSVKVAALLGPSRSASSRLPADPPTRSKTAPLPPPVASPAAKPPSPTPPIPPPKQAPLPLLSASTTTASTLPSTVTQSQIRSTSQPIPAPYTQFTQSSSPQQQPTAQAQFQPNASSNWNSLLSLQSSTNSTLPLQYASPPSALANQPMAIPPQPTSQLPAAPNPFNGLSASLNSPFSSTMDQMSGMSPAGVPSSMSLNTGMALNSGPGVSSSMSPGGASLFQAAPSAFSTPPFMPTQPTGHSPNPFAQQALPTNQSMGYGQQQQQPMTPYSAPAFQAQPMNSPFGQPSVPQPRASPMFQTQSLGPAPMQLQMPQPGNPFLQQQQQPVHTPFGTQPQYAMGGPSPFGQPQQQQPQQQQQQQFVPTPGSVFAGWQNGPQGFPGQQWN